MWSWGKQLNRLAATLALAGMVFGVVPAFAATVTSATDELSTLEAGVAANHDITFVTPTGAAEGSTITLTFDTPFVTTSITEDDVDVSDDGVALTTAATCAGAEEASVAIAGDIVTITICAGDGGAIAAASSVNVRIGNNAVDSGTGANQITNPPGAGTYYIGIAGTFGDSGSMPIAIGGDDSIGVTATVSGQGGGGGGGGGPAPDTTPPVISNVAVSNITATSASITWNTNEDATSAVNYGETVSYEIGTESDGSFVQFHPIDLTNLTPGTTYHFRVRSSDANSNEAVSGDFTFTTLDTTPPIISDIQVVDITTTSVRVIWNTDEPSTSTVNYGLTVSYGTTVSDAALVTSHSLVLTGLEENTLYHFRVRSTDASNNEAVSGDSAFTTLNDPPPANVSNLSATPGDGQVSFTWTNPTDPDFAGTLILRCENEPPSGPDDPDCVTVFNGPGTSFTDTGLVNGTTYHYGVFAFDTAGQFSSGALVSTTPQSANVPPGNVTNLIVTPGDARNSLTWTNPTDPDLARIRVIRCSQAPVGPTDPSCVVIFNALGTSLVDTGLTNGITYHYGIYAEDTVGQFSTGTLGSGTPSAPVEELPPPPPPEVPGEEPSVCGDSICSTDESPASCPVDCGPVSPAAACGNLVCETGEEQSSCAVDCPSDLVPEETLRDDLSFLVAAGRIRLIPSTNQVVRALAGRTASVQLLALHFEKPVERVELTIGTQSYLMARAVTAGGDAFIADVTTPETPSQYPMSITVHYEDASAQSVAYTLMVVSDGYTYADLEGAATRVGASLVTVRTNGAVWDGSPYGQFNPVTTGSDGTFAWYVPNGTYVISAEKEGYLPAQTLVTVTDNIINTRILMASPVIPLPVPPLPFVPESVQDVVDNVAEAVAETLDVIRDVPGVEEAATVSTPVLAATAVLTAITLALGFNLLPLIQYLFTAPILLLGRRRRRAFGTVYNGISKTPVDLATVRLFRLPDLAPVTPGEPEIGRLVQSRVTDRGGRYYFAVDSGRYRIQVLKDGFTFPSEYLMGKTEDGEFLDIYHGEPIVVTDSNATISANIPLDPSQAAEFHVPAKVIFKARLRTLQNAIAILGLILSIVFAIIQPNAFTIAMVFIQLGVYLFVHRLARPNKPQNWGIVYDKESQKPVGRVIARVFEPQYNKLLETTVTDAAGRYNFVLGPNEYYVVFEKEGYEPVEIRPVDYTAQSQPTEFGVKVAMPPKPATT